MRYLPLLLLLVACAAKPPASAPEDDAMRHAVHAGRSAIDRDRPEQAIPQYQAALARARLRDDLPAIADLSYDLAVAQLRANDPKSALATARALRAELARRGEPSFPELDLAEATALYRAGNAPAADTLAASVQRSGDAPGAARASFLRGLIADSAADTDGLAAALASLGAPGDPESQADATELAARLALRQGSAATAQADAARAIALRRDLPDYRGLARALALAGDAAQREEKTEEAADFYLRAGRSAAAQGDPAAARLWLETSRSLAPDPALRDAATAALAALDPEK